MSVHVDRLIDALSSPAIYPHAPESVEIIQTHISVIFLAGSFVYKVKKPVDFGFLDFTTLEKRTHFCNREVVLNSRFSEGIYLDVVSIHEDADGINLEGRGERIEAAVLMNRIPQDRVLLNMLEEDRVEPDMMDRLAERVAYFHGQAETGPEITGFGSVEVITQNIRENYDQTTPYAGLTLDAATHDKIFEKSRDFIQAHKDLFRRRMLEGRIRDCHGDLHLDHVLMLDRIMLFDCIEFNDRFRYGDTAADLAFLLMDLDFKGYPAFAERTAGTYANASDDDGILDLLPFYKSYRAAVRGKVLGFELNEPEISEEEKKTARETARAYFDLALAYLSPSPTPALIITVGLTGTGKSFVSRKLGKRLGVQPIRSDAVRKKIYGVPQDEHRLDKFGEGIYKPNATERTYEALVESARRSLAAGESVIVDASFIRSKHRDRCRRLVEELNSRFVIIEVRCPEETARMRLRKRTEGAVDPSEGSWEIYVRQRTQADPIRADEEEFRRCWDSTTDVNHFLAPLVRDLIAGR